MNKTIVREATETDLPGILEIYNHSIVHTTSVYSYKPHTLEMRRKWFEERKAAGQPVLVSETHGRISGFAAYGPFRFYPAYKYTAEHSVHIHPDFRRMGIGEMLMHELIALAKQNGLHVLIGGIDADNEASIAFHRSLGFEVVAHFPQAGYKFGKWLDLKFMQITFDTPHHPEEDQ